MERRGGVGETREGSDDRAPAPKPGQASANGVAAPLRAVIGLQKSAGNRAVAGLLSGRSGGGGGAGGGGGGGGGGAMKPSTLAGDVGALAQGMAGAQAAAGGAASGLLAAAAPPPGLPVAPEPSLAEPAGPALAEPSGAGMPPVPSADGDSLGVGPTTAGLAARERAEGDAVDAAGKDVAAQAGALRVGPLGASAPLGAVPRAALAATVAPPPDLGGIPTIEPAVAKVLDGGYGGQLSAQAAAAGQEQEAALAQHAQVTGEARAAHDSAVTDEQSSVEGEARELDTRTAGEVEEHKQAWRSEGGRITASSRAELRSLRSGAGADIEQKAGSANSEATTIMTSARKEADQQGGAPPGPPVQRSLWGRIKSAASSAVGAVRSGISAVASAARGLLDAALNKVRGLFDRVRQAIADRINQFVAAARAVAARVRDGLAAAAKAAVGAIRRVVAAARAVFNRLVDRLREFASNVLHNLWSALTAAGAWLRDRFKGLVNGLIRFGRMVLSFAAKVRELLKVTGSKVISGIVRAVKDPGAFIAPYKAQVAGMIAGVPAKAKQMYDEHVAPMFGSGPAPAPAAQRTVQRQETEPAQAPTQEGAGPSHGEILWEFLKDRLSYLGGHWGGVILDALLEIFVPFVSLYRHLPPMLGAVWQGLKDLFAGRFSDAIDAGLKAARELMAILATLFAQASIAAFIAGSIIGTPIVGEGAMLTIGLALLAADVAVQGASIAKAWSNLSRPGRTAEQMGDDYGIMADGVISLGITLALILIAAVGQKLGKVLIARFPKAASALAAIRERLKVKVRSGLGLENPPPTKAPLVDTPSAPAVAPEATGFPGRAGLTPGEQAAFDRFIAGQRAAGNLTPEFEAKLKAMTPDQLRRVAGREIGKQADVEAEQAAQDRAKATNQSNPLDPVMANGPQDVGGGVRIRWNEIPPSNAEITQAQGIARATGEPVELFGDGSRGIDGTIGKPPRPLQLKGPPQAGPAGATKVYDSAVVAHEKAVSAGFRDVETHITAPNVTKAEVAAEFARRGNPGSYVGGGAVRKVQIYCSDGIYVPPSTAVVPPPVHIDEGSDQDKTPAGATP